MSDTLFIRGTSYKINPFSDIHLSTVNKLLNDIGNIAFQSDTGFVLKEVILPALPPDIIRRTQAGDYIIFLSATELNEVLTEVMRFYYDSELVKAKENNDLDYEKQLEANLSSLDTESALKKVEQINNEPANDKAEMEQLRKELAQLKAARVSTSTPQ